MHLSFEIRISQRRVYDGNVPETKKWIGTNKQTSYFFIRFYCFFLQLWKPVWQSLKTEIVSLSCTLGVRIILYYAPETFRSNFMAIIIMSYEKIKVTRNKTYVCGFIKIILNTGVILFLAFYFFTILYHK